MSKNSTLRRQDTTSCRTINNCLTITICRQCADSGDYQGYSFGIVQIDDKILKKTEVER